MSDPTGMVTIQLSQHTYNQLMLECAERNLAPGTVIDLALAAVRASEQRYQRIFAPGQIEALTAGLKRYNLPGLDKRITALEDQVVTLLGKTRIELDDEHEAIAVQLGQRWGISPHDAAVRAIEEAAALLPPDEDPATGPGQA